MRKPNKHKTYRSLFLLIFYMLIFTAFYGCGAGEDSTTTTSTTTTTAGAGTLTLSLSSSTVSYGTSVTASVTLYDGNGALVPNAVVTFAAGSTDVVFTPAAGTALTNASGTASVIINAASVDSSGATSITASASVTTSGTTATVTSTPVGIALNGSAITLGTLTLSQSSISAYGTTSVSAPVLINGSSATVPISVTFTSSCVSTSKATLTSPVTSVAGTATSTYTDNNCASGTDVITASVTGDTKSVTITVAVPATNNISFVSATPAIIGTSTTGATTLPKSSLVKFQVVDSNNNGKAGVVVDFSVVPASKPGGLNISATSATSDSSGYVTTSLTSGTVPTPVWVVATVHGTSILTQSNTLTITTGLPTQNFFSLSVQNHNIEGWDYDGTTSTITIIASDRLGNPVPDGTAINFITEGATILPASCTTVSGTCTVTFKSSAYRPINETTTTNPAGAVAGTIYIGGVATTVYVKNGRVTILAYAVGEKSFIDANGNNSYDAGETFYDLGDLFLDANENGVWDSNSIQPNLIEQYINYAAVASPVACGTHVGGGATITAYPPDYATSPSKETTCSGTWGQNYVRRSATMILSSSHPLITENTFTMGLNCSKTFTFWLMDENNNPMPAGTTVSVASSNVTFQKTAGTATAATLAVLGTPVVDSIHAGGTLVGLEVDGGTDCTSPAVYPSGTAVIAITAPKGLTTDFGITINH